jgi:hypothetical protein
MRDFMIKRVRKELIHGRTKDLIFDQAWNELDGQIQSQVSHYVRGHNLSQVWVQVQNQVSDQVLRKVEDGQPH